MDEISNRLIEFGLKAEEISDVLNITLERAVSLLGGKIRPSIRERSPTDY